MTAHVTDACYWYHNLALSTLVRLTSGLSAAWSEITYQNSIYVFNKIWTHVRIEMCPSKLWLSFHRLVWFFFKLALDIFKHFKKKHTFCTIFCWFQSLLTYMYQHEINDFISMIKLIRKEKFLTSSCLCGDNGMKQRMHITF